MLAEYAHASAVAWRGGEGRACEWIRSCEPVLVGSLVVGPEHLAEEEDAAAAATYGLAHALVSVFAVVDAWESGRGWAQAFVQH